MVDARPTQTSYAVLGLLAIKPWTTYELAKQSERSLRFFFPRAERAVYTEAKRLVDRGWAQSRKEATGLRASTVYRITAAGRRALRQWLGEPSSPTRLESEAALKMFVADLDHPAELRSLVDGIRADAVAALEILGAQASAEQLFPERMPTNILSMRLVADVQAALLTWSDWAADAVAVLESGDDEAIDRQTRDTLHHVADRL
jgi:DNA-binding PadR family transcriptional regulator